MLDRYTTGPRINLPQNIMESFPDVKIDLAPRISVLLCFAFGPREEVDRLGSVLVEYWRSGTLTIE